MNTREPDQSLVARTIQSHIVTLKVLLVVSVTMISGCASYSPKLTSTDSISPESSIMYGVLIKEGINNFGLVVESTSGNKKYNIKFTEEPEIAVVSAVPGTYRIVGIIRTYLVGNEIAGYFKVDELWPQEYQDTFQLKPGVAHYVGNFKGSYDYQFNSASRLDRWAAEKPKQDFAETTRRLKSEYPAFVSVTCEQLFREE